MYLNISIYIYIYIEIYPYIYISLYIHTHICIYIYIYFIYIYRNIDINILRYIFIYTCILNILTFEVPSGAFCFARTSGRSRSLPPSGAARIVATTRSADGKELAGFHLSSEGIKAVTKTLVIFFCIQGIIIDNRKL